MRNKKKNRRINGKPLSNRIVLNIKRLSVILAEKGITKTELARRCGWSKQRLHYHLSRQTIKGAEAVGKALRIEPLTLIEKGER